jgi:MoaA/NifB/PqqE/SkfB family radical SAM enzyme
MDTIEHVHWYIGSSCNLDCSFCFKPLNLPFASAEKLEDLARRLVDDNVRKVTLTGGEPLLVEGLEKVLAVLKSKDVYVSLHTNGVLLDEKKISGLSGLVDDIALPLDSLNRKVQAELRGEEFIPVVKRFGELAESIRSKNIKLGVHTVFTALNRRQMPVLHNYLDKVGFDYWRIYEYNDELVKPNYGRDLMREPFQISEREAERFYEKGGIDCLLAYFLLEEEKMKKLNDARVQFVAKRDTSLPYAFLDNSGNMRYYMRFSSKERPVIGNVLTEGFGVIEKRLKEVDEKQFDYDDKAQEDWSAFLMDQPIWARLYEGNFDFEETEMIKPRYLRKVLELESLFRKREYGEGSLKDPIMI